MGHTNRQRSVYGTLDTIVEDLEASGLGAPAMIIIGEVVAHRSKAEWFEGRPLFGKRIVVTRAREQAGQLTQMLSEQGAEVIELPFISVEQHYDGQRVSEVLAGIAVYEWIIFTSANGVKNFLNFIKLTTISAVSGLMRIAAVEAATAREIEKHKLKVDLIPKQANADALAAELIENEGVESVQLLIVTGNQNRECLVERLESDEGRAIVDTLPSIEPEKISAKNPPPNVSKGRCRRRALHQFLYCQIFVEQHESLKLEPGARKPTSEVSALSPQKP